MSGLGRVPFKYSEATGEVTYQFPHRLRDRECRVSVKFRRLGEAEDDVIAWGFFVDRLPYYLEEGDAGSGEQAAAEEGKKGVQLVLGGN